MNRNAYNRIAAQWDAVRRHCHGREQDYLDAVLAATSPGDRILDLGCGTGRPMAEYLVAHGRRVCGVDQSEAMLDIAKQNLPDQQWIHAALEDFEPEPGYQAALIWDALFHIPRKEHAAILARTVKGLPVGGRLMITVGGSAHPAFTDFMFGEEFFYDSHTPEETSSLLQQLGCRVIIAEYMNIPDGKRDKGRHAFVVEKTVN